MIYFLWTQNKSSKEGEHMRYEKYRYESSHSYTSYSKLSTEEYKSIEFGNFNNIPEFLVYKEDRIELFAYGLFDPKINSNDWTNKSSGWNEHKKTGIRVRLTEKSSANYHRVDGNGTATRILEVWFPLNEKYKQIGE